MNQLFERLVPLQRELHRSETRRDQSRTKMLLHPQFEETGRSGRFYDRDQVLVEFSETNEYPSIRAEDFRVRELAAGLALLTYRSARIDERMHGGQRTIRPNTAW